MTDLYLASTSRYRRRLLDRLGLPFRALAPGVGEEHLPGEPPAARARRLALEKARAVAADLESGLVVGSDQVAVLGERVLDKPGGRARNVEQLLAASGRCVEFLTGVAVVEAPRGRAVAEVVPFRVHLRRLAREEVEAYVEAERAYDCAGGFRCEGLGPAIFERLEGDDPTALEGLPLIRLCRLLAAHGLDPLAPRGRAPRPPSG